MHEEQSRECDRPSTIDGSYAWKLGRPVDDSCEVVCLITVDNGAVGLGHGSVSVQLNELILEWKWSIAQR